MQTCTRTAFMLQVIEHTPQGVQLGDEEEI
jgi:hypothetical protein